MEFILRLDFEPFVSCAVEQIREMSFTVYRKEHDKGCKGVIRASDKKMSQICKVVLSLRKERNLKTLALKCGTWNFNGVNKSCDDDKAGGKIITGFVRRR